MEIVTQYILQGTSLQKASILYRDFPIKNLTFTTVLNHPPKTKEKSLLEWDKNVKIIPAGLAVLEIQVNLLAPFLL